MTATTLADATLRTPAITTKASDVLELFVSIDSFVRRVDPRTWDAFVDATQTLIDGYIRSDEECYG